MRVCGSFRASLPENSSHGGFQANLCGSGGVLGL